MALKLRGVMQSPVTPIPVDRHGKSLHEAGAETRLYHRNSKWCSNHVHKLVLQRAVKRLLRYVDLPAPWFGNVCCSCPYEPLLDFICWIDI